VGNAAGQIAAERCEGNEMTTIDNIKEQINREAAAIEQLADENADRAVAGMLSEQERDDIAERHGFDCMVYEPAFRDIEARLREKNGSA
jgi:hypothetical protein